MGHATSLPMGNNKTFLLGIFKGVPLHQVTPPPQGRYIMVLKPPWDNIPMVKS